MDTASAIALTASVLTLGASIVALVFAIKSKLTADEAKMIAEQNAIMVGQLLQVTKVEPEKSWLDAVGNILQAAAHVAPLFIK